MQRATWFFANEWKEPVWNRERRLEKNADADFSRSNRENLGRAECPLTYEMA
jgi:hypothetical protein